MTAWFRGDVKLPESCRGRKVFVRPLMGAETLFFVDGEPRGVFDFNHPNVMLTPKGVAGRKYHIALEAYSGHAQVGHMPAQIGSTVPRNSSWFDGVQLVLEREDVSAFVLDFGVLDSVMQSLDENSLRRNEIAREFAKVYAIIDPLPLEKDESSWRPRLAEARKILKPLLAAKNGSTAPVFGLIGHSHIDTAWLWPLAETWRKCARTFSSVINLMEQYPEFMFVQPAPCHADVVRREYPALFKRMKKMADAGRWEPNGGMWVEPDANVPSGESFVRQLLVGQAATREMFGVTTNTLWLPDVFGYSAALPQILQGCKVEYFCTQKISWNDTTRFPYDTFVWKGIDGTSVIAHYNTMASGPNPQNLNDLWEYVQHKDVQDRRLCAFGSGDGGGGPTPDEIEYARRIEDLEGCPRTYYTTVKDFMDGVRDELTGLPEWCGELYLELHRGTLTSIAPIKRGNRKSEFALRDAELLCTLASLRGTKYPAAQLLDIWKEVLTNQFHDILPGSSIARVNDEAIEAFECSIVQANELGGAALKKLAGPVAKAPDKLLVVNSLSWDRTGEIELAGVPKGMAPADPQVTAQAFEDIHGNNKLAVSGLTVPALGAVALPLAKGRSAGESPFKIGKTKIETPHAVVRFDKIGRIISFVDKAANREIVRKGGALNSLLIGDDVPANYDNWDIDTDQYMKMAVEDRLQSREIVADGPLQLRIRSIYKLGSSSTLRQDVVFHADTPRVDFETVVDWSEIHKLLKAGFEFDVLCDFARHEIQYGHVERPTHINLPQDRARFEVCAHKWTDLSENGFGVALLNDCKYGIGVKGSELRLTLMKAGTHPDGRGDKGVHPFTYSMLPHACGFSVEAVVRPAYELNVAPVTAPAGPKAEGFDGLLTVDAPNVIVESVKWAEKGKAFVVRLYEAGKTGANVRVAFNANVKSVSETNMLEEEPVELKLKGGSVGFYMRPFEIKTLRCTV